jgi:hypothetical protein
LLLSYFLPSNVSFKSTLPGPQGSGLDPRFTVSFDMDFHVFSLIPEQPCALALQGQFVIANANIDSHNASADFVKTVVPGAFRDAESRINGVQSTKVDRFASLLDGLANSCDQARAMGFTRFAAFVDPASRTVGFRLTHAVDAAPRVETDAAARGPSLFPPALGASQAQVRAGAQLGITGSHFPTVPASQIKIGWNDTTDEAGVTQSDIAWGPAGGPAQTVHKPRRTYDNGNTFTAANLTPNTSYQFRVRNCDAVACSAWSNVLEVRTQGSDQVQLLLDYNSTSTVVGNAVLGGDGGFSTTITVPAAAPAGAHQLWARFAGDKVATTTITLLDVSQNPQARLVFADPNVPGGTLATIRIVETYPLTLRGEGFKPGPVSVYIDGHNGKELGAATADANGMFMAMFTWPRGIYGAHNVIAYEISGGQTTQASASVSAEQLVR